MNEIWQEEISKKKRLKVQNDLLVLMWHIYRFVDDENDNFYG